MRTTRTILASLAVLGLAGAACGSDGDGGAASAAPNPPAAEQPADAVPVAATVTSPAAELRAGLTALLQEHVYLAGIALTTAVGTGAESDATGAAVAALDENSVALSEAVGGVYGDEAGTQFLELWRKHIGFFVDYTLARAGGDDAGAQAARDALDVYRADFGAFLASANPNLPKDAVAEELIPHVTSVFDTIDALVAGDGSVFTKLRAAASHMPHTATVLAGAIAQQFPDRFGG